MTQPNVAASRSALTRIKECMCGSADEHDSPAPRISAPYNAAWNGGAREVGPPPTPPPDLPPRPADSDVRQAPLGRHFEATKPTANQKWPVQLKRKAEAQRGHDQSHEGTLSLGIHHGTAEERPVRDEQGLPDEDFAREQAEYFKGPRTSLIAEQFEPLTLEERRSCCLSRRFGESSQPEDMRTVLDPLDPTGEHQHGPLKPFSQPHRGPIFPARLTEAPSPMSESTEDRSSGSSTKAEELGTSNPSEGSGIFQLDMPPHIIDEGKGRAADSQPTAQDGKTL